MALLTNPPEAYASPENQSTRSSEEIWNGIESNGWPAALLPFQTHFQSGRSYLAIYKKLPEVAMDMRSPNRFKNSMSRGEIAGKSSIGHMSMGWSCAIDDETRVEGFAAQTGEDQGQSKEMAQAGWGLTAFVSTFTDGRIQNGSDIQKYFETETALKIESGKTPNVFTAMVIEVPDRECQQVRGFVKSYVLHPERPWSNFGMIPNPEKFEGSGCGSFAIAALAQSDRLRPLMNSFWREVSLPEKLFGRLSKVFAPNNVNPAFTAPTKSDPYKVSRLKLIAMDWDSGKTLLKLRLIDPELVTYAIRRWSEVAPKSSRALPAGKSSEATFRLRRTFHLVGSSSDESSGRFSAGHWIEDRDSGYQEIDSQFDPSFFEVSNRVDELAGAGPSLVTPTANPQVVWFSATRNDIQTGRQPRDTGVFIAFPR